MYNPSHFPVDYDASSLKGKSVFITGGASGLGAAFARECAKSGAFVIIADLNQDAGVALEEELRKGNLDARFVFCDVASWKSQTDAFKAAISYSPTKSLHTIVAAAGIVGPDIKVTVNLNSEKEEDPPEPAATCIQVNLLGVYYTTLLAIHYMGQSESPIESSIESNEIEPLTESNEKEPIAEPSIEIKERGAGKIDPEQSDKSNISSPDQPAAEHPKSIILVCSLAGYHCVPGAVEYTVSKYGVRGLLKSLRSKTRAANLRLNTIAPTYIETPLLSPDMVTGLKSTGVQFAEAKTAVDAMMILAIHNDIHGRAIGVGALGNFDLRDEAEGLDAGTAMREYADQLHINGKVGVGERSDPGTITGLWEKW